MTAPSETLIDTTERVLVTGSSGFIGAKVVERLIERGFTNLACFVRPSSRLERLQQVLARCPAESRPQLVFGDLMSREDCAKAAAGAAVVYHLAAGQDKSFAGAFMNSALSTRNLIEAFLSNGKPRRFVNVSSFAVYSNLAARAWRPARRDGAARGRTTGTLRRLRLRQAQAGRTGARVRPRASVAVCGPASGHGVRPGQDAT